MINRIRLISFLLGLACLLGITASTLEAGVLQVSPPAFQISDHSLQEIWGATNAVLSIAGWDAVNTSWAYFVAPVSLPQGVTLKKITVYCLDNAGLAADYLSVDFMRTNPLTGEQHSLGGVSTSGVASSPNRRALASPISGQVVNNKLFNYTLVISFPYGCSSQVQFFGAKIEW